MACKTGLLVLAIVLASSESLLGQGPTFASFKTASLEPAPAAPVSVSFVTKPETASPHRFWDGKNRALFAMVAASSAADFCVTRANLASGGRTQPGDARLWQEYSRAGGELLGRDRERDWTQLLIPQDRPPQVGAYDHPGRYQRLRKRGRLRSRPPLEQRIGSRCSRDHAVGLASMLPA